MAKFVCTRFYNYTTREFADAFCANRCALRCVWGRTSNKYICLQNRTHPTCIVEQNERIKCNMQDTRVCGAVRMRGCQIVCGSSVVDPTHFNLHRTIRAAHTAHRA